MKSFKLLMALICLCCTIHGQVITSAEYFYDVDPGSGNGIPFNVGIQGDTIAVSKNISTAGLTSGFHTICIRSIDINGVWSLYDYHSFYILPVVSTVSSIVSAEYFFDVDLGVG